MNKHQYTILYVDDEQSNLRIFRLSFKRHYNVITANNGYEAIEILKKENVDLIITDQKMPEMTGTELLEKTLENNPDMIRIILTGFSDIQSIVKAVNKIGIYKYITKPYDQGELKITLDKALESNKLKLERKNLLEQLEKKNEELEKKVEERTHNLRVLNDRMVESLEYGSLVQRNLLPSEKQLKSAFTDHFVLFKPFDHVSGDFYWFTEFEKAGKNYKIIALMDCMGHGVAGALQSSMAISYLWQIVSRNELTNADEILIELDNVLSEANISNDNSHNSMDGSVVVINETDQTMCFAGCKSDLVYFENGEINHIKGERFSIGSSWNKDEKTVTKHQLDPKKTDSLYMFSDGFIDQMNHDFTKKYGRKQLLETLETIKEKPFSEQNNHLSENLSAWMGKTEQIDDISLIGIKP